MTGCPFCTIDEIEPRTLHEGQTARVVLSNPRLMKGHLLVIPARHVERPWDLKAREMSEISRAVFRFQKKLSATLGTGCDLRQNYRPFIQQGRIKVDHVHFHLLPRTFQDDLYERSMKYETGMFSDLPDGEAEEMKRLLRAAGQY